MQEILQYKLESFEGPLDLLLKLISKNKLNIFDIELSVLLEQYLEQIEKMRESEMEIASEFLEMASRLIYMKTVSLLPKHDEIEQLKEELTGELLEYQICRQIATELGGMTSGFDSYVRKNEVFDFDKTYELTHDSEILLNAYLSAVGRGKRRLPPSTEPFTKIVAKKLYSVSTKIVFVLRSLIKGGTKSLNNLYACSESRSEMVATFLAVLELCKANRIKIEGENEKAKISIIRGHNKK